MSQEPNSPSLEASGLEDHETRFSPVGSPRVWLLTDGLSPIAVALARRLLEHGDYVLAGVIQDEYATPRGDALKALMCEEDEVKRKREDENRSGSDLEEAEEAQKEEEETEEEEQEEKRVDQEAEEEETQGQQETAEEQAEEEEGQESNVEDAKREQNQDEEHKYEQDDNQIKSSGAKTTNRSWKNRLRTVWLDGRHTGQMQAGIAQALQIFGHIDVLLLCRSSALLGTVEEVSQSARTRSLVTDQFETNYFGPVNIIKAVLPLMRKWRKGHIIVLTSITASLGTPGLGMYCASHCALEGFCNSLAYEIAPFNVKLTVVQPDMEIGVFTNKITSAPTLPAYTFPSNSAPLARTIFQRLLNTINPPNPVMTDANADANTHPSATIPRAAARSTTATSDKSVLSSPTINSIFPDLPADMQQQLVAETAYSLFAIGGHENPPTRLSIGFEAIASIKEKLKTISEELEDFVEI